MKTHHQPHQVKLAGFKKPSGAMDNTVDISSGSENDIRFTKPDNKNPIARFDHSEDENIGDKGPRPGLIPRRINANELDDDDIRLMELKRKGWSDSKISQTLADEGRVRYNAKSVSSRFARLVAVEAEQREKALNNGTAEWKYAEDILLSKAVYHARLNTRDEIRQIRERFWSKVATLAGRLDPNVALTEESCRQRWAQLLDDDVHIPAEVADDREAALQAQAIRIEKAKLAVKEENERIAQEFEDREAAKQMEIEEALERKRSRQTREMGKNFDVQKRNEQAVEKARAQLLRAEQRAGLVEAEPKARGAKRVKYNPEVAAVPKADVQPLVRLPMESDDSDVDTGAFYANPMYDSAHVKEHEKFDDAIPGVLPSVRTSLSAEQENSPRTSVKRSLDTEEGDSSDEGGLHLEKDE